MKTILKINYRILKIIIIINNSIYKNTLVNQRVQLVKILKQINLAQNKIWKLLMKLKIN